MVGCDRLGKKRHLSLQTLGEDVHVEDFGDGRVTLRKIVGKFLVRWMNVVEKRVQWRSFGAEPSRFAPTLTQT
jgi:hypothetical protein